MVTNRGRGAQISPGNRFEDVHLEVLPEVMEEQAREHPSGVQVTTKVFADATKSIINSVNSPDLNFKWTINPYRGCEHGCIYCYARPTHEALGFSCGLDFETKIVAKLDAPDLLRRELAEPTWRPEPIVMSGVTDPYQPVERELRVTRRCLEVLAACRQPVSIVTKSRLVLRDLDLLQELARHGAVSVGISVTTRDGKLARIMEPRASAPNARLETIRQFREGGIPVGVLVAPIIPGINDREIPAILKAVSEAGAQSAAWVMLRLPFQIKELFLDWLERHFPDRRKKVENFVREMRGGKLYDSTWGERRRGRGVIAEQIKTTFDAFRRRYGLDGPPQPLSGDSFIRPMVGGKMALFGES